MGTYGILSWQGVVNDDTGTGDRREPTHIYLELGVITAGNTLTICLHTLGGQRAVVGLYERFDRSTQ